MPPLCNSPAYADDCEVLRSVRFERGATIATTCTFGLVFRRLRELVSWSVFVVGGGLFPLLGRLGMLLTAVGKTDLCEVADYAAVLTLVVLRPTAIPARTSVKAAAVSTAHWTNSDHCR